MNNNDFNSKDKDSSLSDMINDYESDNALRNKIETIKKQKAAEEEARKQAEIQMRMAAMEKEKQEATKAVQTNEARGIPPETNAAPYISADVDATQVFSSEAVTPQDDGDKTLVIMDNMKQRNFNTTISIDDVQPEPEKPQEEDRLAPEFEVNDEKISEEDMKEYLTDEKKKKKKPMDDNKKNKMITYTIAGIASICVIGLVIFGLNFFGIIGGGDTDEFKFDETTVDNKVNMEEIGANNFTIKGTEVEKVTDATLIKLAKAEARSTEDQTKVQVTTVDKTELKEEKGTYKVTFSTKKGTKVTVKATVSEVADKEDKDDKDTSDTDTDTKDNSAKINELEGQINSNNNQISTLQSENAELESNISSWSNDISYYNGQLTTSKGIYDGALAKMNTAKDAWNAAKGTAGEADAKVAYDAANSAYETAKSNNETLSNQLNPSIADLNSKVSNARTQQSSNQTKISELESTNNSLKNQLDALK